MTALSAALLGLSAVSKFVSDKKQGAYEAGQLDVNAGLADTQAADALARGKETASRLALDTRQTEGSQRVSLAAQGVDIGSGTAADLQSDTAMMGALDRVTALNNAKREAYGYQVEATSDRSRADMVRSSTASMGRTTLLTAASQLYAMKLASNAAAVPESAPGFPPIQQTYDAGRNPASNDYSRIKIVQPKYRGK